MLVSITTLLKGDARVLSHELLDDFALRGNAVGSQTDKPSGKYASG